MTCEINNAIYDFKEVHFYGALFHSCKIDYMFISCFFGILVKKIIPPTPENLFRKTMYTPDISSCFQI